MFIKTSIFKKLLKEAYKNDNLSVGHSEKAKVYYIVGGYWFVAIQEQFFPNAEKAALVELIGDLPRDEYVRIHKNESRQQLVPDEMKILLAEKEPDEYLEETNLLIEEPKFGVISRLLTNGSELTPINEGLYNMIDESAKTSDDMEIVGPYRIEESGKILLWRNNTSLIGLLPRGWDKDEDLMEQKTILERTFQGKW